MVCGTSPHYWISSKCIHPSTLTVHTHSITHINTNAHAHILHVRTRIHACTLMREKNNFNDFSKWLIYIKHGCLYIIIFLVSRDKFQLLVVRKKICFGWNPRIYQQQHLMGFTMCPIMHFNWKVKKKVFSVCLKMKVRKDDYKYKIQCLLIK